MATLTPTFRKQDPNAPAGFYSVEAAGLRWLAEAEADGGATMARVLFVGDHEIVLERVLGEPASPWGATQLGERLAITHARGADWFGQPPPSWPGHAFIGSLPLPMIAEPPRDRRTGWGRFYAEHRLLPFLRAARDQRTIDPSDGRMVEAVCQRLVDGHDLAGPPEPPARLHGDLWSGNVLWSHDGPVLIDPAAHGGHRETDLAMLDLFGLPHLDRVIAAYDATRPLAPGWRDRVGLHQLHPLLVHAVLFGGGYGAQAAAIARRYT